jgi:predicted extracellular nuclease
MHSPLILGLCEIENKAVVQDVIKGGDLRKTHAIVHYESLDQRGIDNAIIYDSTKLNLAESGIIRFRMPTNDSPSRDIIWAKLYIGNDTILTMVNHWPSRYGGQIKSESKRLIAAHAAKKFIDSVTTVNPDIKIVFMGDLNDYPDNKAPQLITATLKPMITQKSGNYGGSHNYRGDWNILDHIMVSNSFLKKRGMHVSKKSGVIYSNQYLLSTYKGNIVPFRTYGGKKYLAGYSDHLPVSINFHFN